MKKIIVGGGLLLVFFAYALDQNQETPVAIKPPANFNNGGANDNKQNSNTKNSGSNNSQSSQSNNNQNSAPSTTYKDGSYTGNAADAYYGNIQIQATISGGKITNIHFLQYPNDRGTSIAINQQADPMLAQEAIQAQSANVDIISGATDSSQAFIQSLQSALDQAKQ